MSSDRSKQVSAQLRKVLNIHGHGFHYAVVRLAQKFFESKRSNLIFDCVEFPVITGGKNSHIDFVLRSSNGYRILVVAECKRADPAKTMWCFAPTPYTWRDASSGELNFDYLEYKDNKTMIRKSYRCHIDRGIYHLGFELKTGQKGDGSGQTSSAIDQAISQVLRGTGGLINHQYNSLRDADWASLNLNEENRMTIFIPAVFTTAQLWVADVDLGSADLKNGNLDEDAVKAQKADWIWFTYNRSPILTPDVKLEREGKMCYDFSVDLRREFARSVAVIGPEGLDNFLSTNFENLLL